MIRKTTCILLLFVTAINAEDATDLPLRKVVMFNAGLGYFEHEQLIDGNVEIELRFDKSDINDVLKSLVVQDMGGGQISSVSYPSRAPVSEQLRNFSMDLTKQPTLGELLHQLRGEELELDGGKMAGTILGVELKPHNVGQQVMNREVLNLLTDKGLRAVPLESASEISLANKTLDAELRNALKLLATGRRVDTKAVRFKFTGDDQRRVRIGYIRETPIWKTSYRVVLNGKNTALLQGWAIVDNSSPADWENVSLTLTSGRPVTFQMDLYRPLFVERPTLLPSIPPSLASRVYSPALQQLDMDQSLAQDGSQEPFNSIPVIVSSGRGGGFGGGGFGGGMGGMGGMGGGGGGGFGGGGNAKVYNAGDLVVSNPSDRLFGAGGGAAEQFDASQGVVAQATASEIGEQFQYRIASPVTLASQHSAMIPIVDQKIEAEKLSIFTAGGDQENPMLAFRMTNTTELRLSGGPVTVFDGGAYAGDARIEYLQPAEKRLISYAQDTDLTLRYKLEKETRKQRHAQIDLAVLNIEYDLERKHRYRIQSKSDDDRALVVEQPRGDVIWKLKDQDQPAEKTDDVYRFELAAPAGKTVELIVVETSDDEERFDLKTIDPKSLEDLLLRKEFPADVLKVIEQVHDLRVGIANLEASLNLQAQLLEDIKAEQSRIRSNMSALQPDSDPYRRYVTKLNTQEDYFDKAIEAIQQTRVKSAEMQRELMNLFPSSSDDAGNSGGIEAADLLRNGNISDNDDDRFRK